MRVVWPSSAVQHLFWTINHAKNLHLGGCQRPDLPIDGFVSREAMLRIMGAAAPIKKIEKQVIRTNFCTQSAPHRPTAPASERGQPLAGPVHLKKVHFCSAVSPCTTRLQPNISVLPQGILHATQALSGHFHSCHNHRRRHSAHANSSNSK